MVDILLLVARDACRGQCSTLNILLGMTAVTPNPGVSPCQWITSIPAMIKGNPAPANRRMAAGAGFGEAPNMNIVLGMAIHTSRCHPLVSACHMATLARDSSVQSNQRICGQIMVKFDVLLP